MPIFYIKNRFHVIIDNWDPRPLVKYSEKIRTLKPADLLLLGATIPSVGGQSNWQNLHEWLKRCHESLIFRVIAKPSDVRWVDWAGLLPALEAKLIALMFFTVEQLANSGQEWEYVERFLKEQYEVLASLNPNWRC
jgi:hypothetical protein